MLNQISGNKITFERFYTGEMNMTIEKPNGVVVIFEWDYNPLELDEDLLKLIMLNNASFRDIVIVRTPYVPYLRSDKLLNKCCGIEQPMIGLIRDLCNNVYFVAPQQHNELPNIEIDYNFEQFDELCKTHLIVAGDSSEYKRLQERGVDSVCVTKERTSDGIMHSIAHDDKKRINESDKPICVKDDLLSFGGTVVSICKIIDKECGKDVDTVCVEFADGLHKHNKDFTNVNVVALHENKHGGYLR